MASAGILLLERLNLIISQMTSRRDPSLRRVAALVWLLAASCAHAATPSAPGPGDTVQSATHRDIPGRTATRWLYYSDLAVQEVLVSGSWSAWCEKHLFEHIGGGVWGLDLSSLGLAPGRYEFKFLPDDAYEHGDNRLLYVNEDGLLERPPNIIASARIDAPNEISVVFNRRILPGELTGVRLDPEAPIDTWNLIEIPRDTALIGSQLVGDKVTFYFDEATYETSVSDAETVYVAGPFNGWDSDSSAHVLSDADGDNVWELTLPAARLQPASHEDQVLYKFVVNGDRWMEPPAGADNIAVEEGTGIRNLAMDTTGGHSQRLRIRTAQPIDLTQRTRVALDGIRTTPLIRDLTPGGVLDAVMGDEPLGARIDKTAGTTTYRLFSPRASAVDLCLYDSPAYEVADKAGDVRPVAPQARISMTRLDGGIWEVVRDSNDAGRYYSFSVSGPDGLAEGFNAAIQVGDPYALSMAHAENNSIVIDPDETNAWFAGWTDDDFQPHAPEDTVLYEMHVRDFTVDESSGVVPALRGSYAGLVADGHEGRGLDYLKELGVTSIELMPVHEFNNGADRHDWGYAPCFFFAPEASYAQAPLEGSQYYEFKNLVNELHREGFSVLLDVVYNHVGGVNAFNLIDKKYYFRLTPDLTHSNASGCGNDLRTEAPMLRRLIVENVLYWMREFHIDGFRFDLAELIDMETLREIERRAHELNPDVILISEPWSSRGNHKHKLSGSSWAAWNDVFRDSARQFSRGNGDRDRLQRSIEGSVREWTATPMQSINYLESHDDKSLADELTTNPDHDGREFAEHDAETHRLAATLLFTSLGIPMIAEGQAFARSKHGIHNTYDQGDAINAIRWTDKDRPVAADLVERTQAEIRRLSPKLRDTLLLAASGEHTYDEIGRMLGVPLGTVKWRVAEARRLVKLGTAR